MKTYREFTVGGRTLSFEKVNPSAWYSDVDSGNITDTMQHIDEYRILRHQNLRCYFLAKLITFRENLQYLESDTEVWKQIQFS